MLDKLFYTKGTLGRAVLGGARKSLTSRGAALPSGCALPPGANRCQPPRLPVEHSPFRACCALDFAPRSYNRPMPAAGPAPHLAIVQFVFVSTWTIYIVFPARAAAAGRPRQGLAAAYRHRRPGADGDLRSAFGIAAAARPVALRGASHPRARDQPRFLPSPSSLLPQMAATARCCWH